MNVCVISIVFLVLVETIVTSLTIVHRLALMIIPYLRVKQQHSVRFDVIKIGVDVSENHNINY